MSYQNEPDRSLSKDDNRTEANIDGPDTSRPGLTRCVPDSFTGADEGEKDGEDPLREGIRFLDALGDAQKRYPCARIVFHNDMDGFASSLIAHGLLRRMGYKVDPKTALPCTHIEVPNIDMKNEMLHFFVDIRPQSSSDPGKGPGSIGENVFCVDHHIARDSREVSSSNFFIFCTHEEEGEFPPTATSLMSYLLCLEESRDEDYHSFMRCRHSNVPPSLRYLILQATIADHLWLLSKDIPPNPLKLFTVGQKIDVELYIRLSIATSLMLGRKKDRMKGLTELYGIPLEEVDDGKFLVKLEPLLGSVEAIFGFVERVRKIFEELSGEVMGEIHREMSTIEIRMGNDGERLTQYRDVLVEAETEGGSSSREKDFYTQESQKIGSRLAADGKRYDMLKQLRAYAGLGSLRGLALFVPSQENEQTRGILSSLLYYFGWKNIIIEGSDEKSTWSSRGWGREYLEELLTTVTIDSPKEFDEYRLTDIAKKKHPDIMEEEGGVPSVTIISGYSGGMGGRGKIFGGIITGQALPPMDAVEEGDPDVDREIDELPERRFWSPAVQAIRNRFFEDNGWLTIQVGGGRMSSSILENKFDILIVHFMGSSRTFRVRDAGEVPSVGAWNR